MAVMLAMLRLLLVVACSCAWALAFLQQPARVQFPTGRRVSCRSDGGVAVATRRSSPPCWHTSAALAQQQQQRQALVLLSSTDGGGNDGTGDGSKGGGGGGGEGGKGDGEGSDYEGLPEAFALALKAGELPKEALAKYQSRATSPLLKFLLQFEPWRARLLGDRAFMVKLGIEITNGALAQVLAEYEKRRDRFFKEFDFVLADILTCCFANFAAVWASCPTMRPVAAGAAATGGGAFSGIGRFLASCPSNAFQRVTAPATGYSVAQRGMALLRPMPQLFVIGFGACAAGYGLTAVMTRVRLALDPTLVKETEAAPIVKTSLAIGAFLAVSSNLRYQLIAGGLEQRFLDVAFAARPAVANAGSFVLRTANLYLGASMIVDWLRIVGVQGSGEPEATPAAATKGRNSKR